MGKMIMLASISTFEEFKNYEILVVSIGRSTSGSPLSLKGGRGDSSLLRYETHGEGYRIGAWS